MIKRFIYFIGIFGALSIYWRHSFGYYFIGTDEFFVFSQFASAADAEELISFIFTPHNRHLSPVFKSFFYLEYLLFGTSAVPYHAVSIGLYGISAALLWKFLKTETDNTFATSVCTVVYMTNTVYYSIITWVFLQQSILTFIFIELSLLKAQGSTVKDRGLMAAGIYCLMASLCLSFGAAAWLFTAVYYLSRIRSLPSEERTTIGQTVLSLIPLAVSAAATFILYLKFFPSLSESHAEKFAFDFHLIAKGIAVILGDIIMDTFGTYYIIEFAAEHSGTSVNSLMSMLRAAIFASFFFALAASLYMSRKLNPSHRASALCGVLLSLLCAAIIMAASLPSWNFDVYEVTNIIRYKYFPFLFLLVAAAPYLAGTGKKLKTGLAVVIPFWILLHASANKDLAAMNSERINAIKKVMTQVSESVDYPIRKKEGQLYLQKTVDTNSRIIENIKFFSGQPMYYPKLLQIYKKPGEIITRYDNTYFYLKNYKAVEPDALVVENGSSVQEGEKLKVSGEERLTIRMKKGAMPSPAPLLHLHMKIKPESHSEGRLLCTSKDGNIYSIGFEIKGSFVHKRYLLPCPSGTGLALEIAPGRYSIKDLRVYY